MIFRFHLDCARSTEEARVEYLRHSFKITGKEMLMVIDARSLSVPLDDDGSQLVEAVRDFAQSSATRALYRESESRAVRCDLRVPLYRDCKIDPKVLARALRKLWRETMENAASGDRMIIDFLRDGDSWLILRAIDSRETDVPDVRAIGPDAAC